ncbi:NAD(P)-binding protein [Cryphonectria parasitica EP155]|uniref:NAD(P)-binding protein n=1 Tax=Cryphonectria parasitica (strain ATCC 38755 / EP155) TaxID=660469 RepID=A0A9P4Y260_CRYP1|nr:NAD(P)-binding protein [Cryphonectria parasitica EP155]KAF3765624.1 NAD(P)-binding protein [Cryphonectria parasitica EP155]
MTEILYSESDVQALKDKVVVLTGGAQGVGAATVALYHGLGAHVYFGDWDESKGKEVEQELQSKSTGGSAHFQKLDVRDYASQLSLFDVPFKKHGTIDVAVSCAAVREPRGWFEGLDLESVKKEPTPLREHIDINLVSVISFNRIALAYMKASKPQGDGPAFSKSICMVSSIAGLTESPGLFAYAASKHGVIGLLRALRPWAPVQYGVRVNAICPWATDTQMLGSVRDDWIDQKLPLNAPHDVAKIIVQCSGDPKLNGTAIFATGGKYFDTEKGIDKTMPQWLGDHNAKEFNRGQRLLGIGEFWAED